MIRVVPAGLLMLAGAARAAGTGPPDLRWGGDAEGGAPFVEADPADPARVRGFDVEIAGALAKGLGRTPQFVQVAYQSIDQSAQRGDFDIGLSGVEDTPARRAALSVTLPYFEFREVLAVRASEAGRFRTLADFRGRRVGTLSGTIAWEILLKARAEQGIQPVSYDDDVHPYEDLARGRLDAVLLDHILAARSLKRVSGLAILPQTVATGRYVGVLAKENAPLRDAIDALLKGMMRDWDAPEDLREVERLGRGAGGFSGPAARREGCSKRDGDFFEWQRGRWCGRSARLADAAAGRRCSAARNRAPPIFPF